MVSYAKNKKTFFVATLMVALIVFFIGAFSSNRFDTKALNPDEVTKTITITKVWDKDDDTVRPDNVVAYLHRVASILIPGTSLEEKNEDFIW